MCVCGEGGGGEVIYIFSVLLKGYKIFSGIPNVLQKKKKKKKYLGVDCNCLFNLY